VTERKIVRRFISFGLGPVMERCAYDGLSRGDLGASIWTEGGRLIGTVFGASRRDTGDKKVETLCVPRQRRGVVDSVPSSKE